MLEKLKPYQSGLIFLLVAGGFVALLLADLGATNEVRCSLCVEFGGRRECATGQGVNRRDALQSAQGVACAPMTSGPNDAFRCTATPPSQVSCTDL